eukprot:2073550-Pyramimonas_sp.AAC.2
MCANLFSRQQLSHSTGINRRDDLRALLTEHIVNAHTNPLPSSHIEPYFRRGWTNSSGLHGGGGARLASSAGAAERARRQAHGGAHRPERIQVRRA